MPFIFSEAENVEETKVHQRLKGKRKGPDITISFCRERSGIFGCATNAMAVLLSLTCRRRQRLWRRQETSFSSRTILKRS